MPRSGVEPKPPWSAVPLAVRRDVAEALGAPVARAMRAWGGYGPTPTYRLRLTDGRRAFLKATNIQSNPFMRAALIREVRIYEELGDTIAPWAPAMYGAFERADWSVLLLEDAGPPSVPPWTPARLVHATNGLAAFHRSTLGTTLPDWLPRTHGLGTATEERMGTTEWREAIAALAGAEGGTAYAWLAAHLPALQAAQAGIAAAAPPWVLLHGDARSDNLRLREGRLVLFDWPHATRGPREDDLAGFAQTVTVEGGPAPEDVVARYVAVAPVRAEVLTAAVASYALFFADAAWRPEVPGLPRLRAFQLAQLKVTLAWVSRRLELPAPSWLDQAARRP